MYQGQPRSRPDALPDRGPAVGAPGTRWGAIGYTNQPGGAFPYPAATSGELWGILAIT
jgi:hypothetical protein